MDRNTGPDQDKLWSNPFIIINLIAFSGFFSEYLMATALPLYSLKLGGNESTAGAFMAIIAITALIVRPFIGNFMDLKSRKLVVVLAILAFAVVSLGYGLVASIPLLMVLAMVHGFGLSSITTAAPTVVVDISPPSRLEEGVSMYGIAMNLTAAVGPIAALYLINSYTYKVTFSAAFFIALAALVLTLALNYENTKKTAGAPKKQTSQKALKLDVRSLFEKTALKPALYQLFMAFASSIIYSFIPIYAASRGIKNIGLFFLLNAITGLIASFITGKLVLKFGIRKNFIPALSLFLLSFILLAFAQTLPLMLVGAAFYGFANGVGMAIVNIIGMKLAPAERRGAANATMYAAMDIGVATGSFGLGLVAARFGFTATFLIAAALIGLDIVLFTLLNKELPAYDDVARGTHVVLMGPEEVNIMTENL